MDPPPKKLLVLDVNGLLVDTYFFRETHPKERPDAKIGSFFVYKRPHCHEFVAFCLEHFVVGIWSSARQHNVDNLVNYIFGEAKSKLAFIWHQLDCTDTGLKSPGNQYKPLFLKELSKLWSKIKGELPWKEGEYGPTNTLLIDDTPYKALRNPPNTAIFPRSYIADGSEDNFLGDALRMYLEGVRDAFNVQQYVKNNPFGEPSVTPESPLWRYFSKLFEMDQGCSNSNLAISNVCLATEQREQVETMEPPEDSNYSFKKDTMQLICNDEERDFSNNTVMSSLKALIDISVAPGRDHNVALLEVPTPNQTQDGNEMVELMGEECLHANGGLQPRSAEALPCNNDDDFNEATLQSMDYDAQNFRENNANQDKIIHAKSKTSHVCNSENNQESEYSQIREYRSDSLARSYHRKHEVRWKNRCHRHTREDSLDRSGRPNFFSSSNRFSINKDVTSSRRKRSRSRDCMSHLVSENHEKRTQIYAPEAYNRTASENGNWFNHNDQPDPSRSYFKNRDWSHANNSRNMHKVQRSRSTSCPGVDTETNFSQSYRYNRGDGWIEDAGKSQATTNTWWDESGTAWRTAGYGRKSNDLIEETNHQSPSLGHRDSWDRYNYSKQGGNAHYQPSFSNAYYQPRISWGSYQSRIRENGVMHGVDNRTSHSGHGYHWSRNYEQRKDDIDKSLVGEG